MLKKELHRLINKGRSFCHEERPFGVLGGILVEKDGFRIRLVKKSDAENYYTQNFCPLNKEVARLTGSLGKV